MYERDTLWIEMEPYRGFRGFTKDSNPFTYTIGHSTVSDQETVFVRAVDDVNQALQSAKQTSEGEYLASYVVRKRASTSPRPMMPEELDDFSEDFNLQLQSFELNIPKEILERNLESNLAQARRQTSEHMRTYNFIRNHDMYPFYDIRIMHLAAIIFNIHPSPEFRQAYDNLTEAFRRHPGDDLDAYVPAEVLARFKELYEIGRKMYSQLPSEVKIRYIEHVKIGIGMATLGALLIPHTLVNIPTEKEFPEFKPEMGIPVLRSSYK